MDRDRSPCGIKHDWGGRLTRGPGADTRRTRGLSTEMQTQSKFGLEKGPRGHESRHNTNVSPRWVVVLSARKKTCAQTNWLVSLELP